MPPELAGVIERVTALRQRAQRVGRGADGALLAEIDDTLTEGYAHALTGDAWSMHCEKRLHELISAASAVTRGRELRALAGEHAGFQREIMALRRELAELRRDRDRLVASSPARAP